MRTTDNFFQAVVIGSQGVWVHGAEPKAHSFAGIRDTKEIPHSGPGLPHLPPPPSLLLYSQGLSTFDLSLQIIFPISIHLFEKENLLSIP